MKTPILLLLVGWLFGLLPDLEAQNPPTNQPPARPTRSVSPGVSTNDALTPRPSTNRVFVRPTTLSTNSPLRAAPTPTTAGPPPPVLPGAAAPSPSAAPPAPAGPVTPAPTLPSGAGATASPAPVLPGQPAGPLAPGPAQPPRQPLPTGLPGQPTVNPPVAPPSVVPPGPARVAPAAPTAGGGATPAGAASEDDQIIPIDDIKFSNMPVEQFLDIYAQWTRRTILRPAQLPQLTISIKAQTPLTRREAIQAFDSVLALNGYTIIAVGEKFASFVPNAQAVQEGAAFSTTEGKDLPEAAQYITQIVQLKHINPSEIQQVIVPFAKNPTGIVPIDPSMILVLRDYAVNVKRMLEVIEKVDIMPEQEYKLEVIPIRYGKVEDIYNTMSSLTGGGGGVSGGTARTTGARSSRTGSRYGGASSRFGGTGTLGNQQLRQQGTAQTLQAGQPQSSFQGRLQQIISRASGGDMQILGDARIVPDERSNSLLVYATKEDMKMITNIVAKVDTLLAQVLIEAIIMEVGLDKGLTFGVSGAYRDGKGSNQGIGVVNNDTDVLGSVRNFLGNAGTTNAIPGGGGLSYLGSFGDSWTVAMRAIATDSSVNVLSRPRIQTTHAVPATFEVGSTVPYITGTYYSDYGGTGGRSSYQQLPVVTSLNVTPFITPDGLVVMELDQHIEDLGAAVEIDGNKVPTTTTRSAASTVSVKDGEMILLGGFISETKSKSRSGVPLLKDIPVLGALFRSNSDTSKRTELIILMRPTVLDTAEKAAQTARDIPGYKSKAISDEVEEESKKSRSTAPPPSVPLSDN